MRRCATIYGMTERPEQRAEGKLIARAQKRARLSGRKAAELAKLSEGHWRAIVSGARSIAEGVWVPVRAPADTLARMALVVQVTPGELETVGRFDAAEELRTLLQELTHPEPSPDDPEWLAAITRQLDRLVAARTKEVDDKIRRRDEEWAAEREALKRQIADLESEVKSIKNEPPDTS